MKEELKGPKVEHISVAIICENPEEEERNYNVYLINQKEETLEQVIVNSKGYLINKESGEKIETNTLRKYFGNIPPHTVQMIEPIMEDVLLLNNEYWVSFWINEKMYDKKYIFLAESFVEENWITVPIIGKRGILVG